VVRKESASPVPGSSPALVPQTKPTAVRLIVSPAWDSVRHVTYHEKQSDATRWIVHGERSIYESEWVRLSLVDVELPDGQRFDHHVVRMPAAAMSVVLDEQDRVLLMWRHRFVSDIWN